MESIISRSVILRLAEAAALREQPLEQANPYPLGSAASIEFEVCYEAAQEALDELDEVAI